MRLKIIIIGILVIFCVTSIWSQSQNNENRVVKVLTFNILHGATTRGDFNLDVLVNVIKESAPDFVALQEVDFKTKRAKQYDLTTELGWRAKMIPIFARAMKFDGGEYGEGILSKYTFLATKNVALPYSKGNEPRAALEVISILKSGDTISFVATHLDHLENERDRIKQIKKINEVFTKNKYPTILAGDLNDVPGSTPINLLEEFWKPSYNKISPKFTFPSNNPSIKIDYVMCYPKDRWRIIKTEVIQDTVASDHCAYLVTLALKN